MRIEVSIAKTTALPNGALEALNNELSRRIAEQFPAIDSQVSVRYATGNQLSVFGALKEDKDRIFHSSGCSGQTCTGLSVCCRYSGIPAADKIKIHVCRWAGGIYRSRRKNSFNF